MPHGWVLATSAVATAALLAFHRTVPRFMGGLGSLLESFLPWLGLVVVTLLGLALLRRSAVALVALLLPTALWTHLYGGLLLPRPAPGPRDLVVVQEDWSRALRAVVRTPHGEIAVYVAHLPSVRVRASGLASSWRDESAGLLGRAVEAEARRTVILLGDLNGTVDDRGLEPVTSRMRSAERGFAFTFPASFPLARIDQVMARSARVSHLRTLPATGSDHLPVAALISPEGGPAGR